MTRSISKQARWIPFATVCLYCLLLGAATAPAQSDELVAGADSVTALNTASLPESPEPVEPVNLWDTGISPTKAVLMTPVFPGWGQLYARNSWQAALGFGAELYFWSNMLVRDRRAVRAKDYGDSYPPDDPIRQRYRTIADENWEQMRDFAWWSGGVLLIIALDAYVGGHLYNFDQDPVPVPDRWDETFGQVGDSAPGSGNGPTLTVFQWRKTF
jgi:hypothetical protein